MLDRRVVFLSVLLIVACAKKETATEPPSSVAAPPPASTPTTSSPMTETTATTSSAAPSSAPATPAAEAVATADGEEPGVSLVVKELKRGSGGIVSLKFVMTNGSSKRLGFGYAFADPDKQVADFGSVGGVQLIDPVGKKKYFVARDAEGKCICSRGLKDVAAGSSVNAWAKFPAPPDDVQKISVIVPHFSPMDDVPISK